MRVDAQAKASGSARYTGDVSLPGMLSVAVVRSAAPHARLLRVETKEAAAAEGVVGVYTAADVASATYGRAVQDIPILAGERVRFVGERIAAVVAETRAAAEAACGLVEVDYEELRAVTTATEALAPGAPWVHDAPWDYPGAVVRVEDGPNLQSRVVEGSREEVEEALASADHVVDATYATPAVHQGYLEPQACVAEVSLSGQVRLWLTTKSPYRLRTQLARCLGIEADAIDVQPVMLGGDFGGKGSPGDAPLCVELSRLTGRPVKLVLRYGEDLTATDVRHPSQIRVRVGSGREGRLRALAVEALFDGGAYAGFKPLANANLHGVLDCATAYRVPAVFVESRVAYTNTLPKGHMRSPGAPQAAFALESALDELALSAGLDPVELRRANLAAAGEANAHGKTLAEARGRQTLEAALSAASAAAVSPCIAPEGWLVGRGVAVYARGVPMPGETSLSVIPIADDRVRIKVPIPETGTGSHTVVRERFAAGAGLRPESVEVVQVSTDALPTDSGVGGSRVTVGMTGAATQAAAAWRDRKDGTPIVVTVGPTGYPPAVSYCVQVAQVAVDPGTGQLKVMELLTAVDVAEVVNEQAHQMQIDGGAVMGYGFAALEDLAEDHGQVWAANLGEFKLASSRDVPPLRTVLIRGGTGVGPANVKPIGELTNVPTAAAIANAVAAASGCRLRQLPLTAERIHAAFRAATRGAP